jgi:diguanylate cyclase (GGDEF)-like protein
MQTERLRIGALRNYKILDTPPEEAFERIVRLARSTLRVPIAQISFIDRERQWLKAGEGAVPREMPRGESFCTYTLESDAPLVVRDAQHDARFCELPLVKEAPFVRAYAGVPLRSPLGLHIGTLAVMDTAVREIGPQEVSILQDLAHLVMDELELRLVSSTDSLTGALSRLAFLNTAGRDIAEARRKPRDLSCILLDLDAFKAMNDTYGHAVGDRILQEVVVMIRADLRAGQRGEDYLGRLGGEEFAILLPGAGRAAAREVGERLRQRMMQASFAVPGGEVQLTVSLGVASLNHGDTGIEDLLRRADDALYAAKTAGRNRLVSDEPPRLALVVS